MIKHSLTSENYFSPENSLKYMGVSQYKAFKKCENAALAECNGTYSRDKTTALLVGSYVDAYFEGTIDDFKRDNGDIFTKNGQLKSEYRQADVVIDRVLRDELFVAYMGGEKQRIMVGEIANVPFKIKVDSLHSDKIVDLKCMRSFDAVWNEATECKEHFIRAWGYDIQGAIYQEIVRQNTGKKLPFYIAACTKEKHPNIDIWSIPDDYLERILDEVKSLAPRYQRIKQAGLQPMACGECDYCKSVKKLTKPRDFLLEVDCIV